MSIEKLPDWRFLAQLSDEALSQYDIAVTHLACAVGLPGAEEIQSLLIFFWLDHYAQCVREYTEHRLPDFHYRPHRYNNSEAFFRMLCLVTVLQRDMGVRYNPAKIPESAVFELPDTFIHGIFQGDGGTCATLPVVYAAVGRRLGYPLKLVTTYGGPLGEHLFVRWDDPVGERFNIEATNRGLNCFTDDYYRTGRYAMTPEMEAEGWFLKSETPRMELAHFLTERALCWRDYKRWRQCVESLAYAVSLVPTDRAMDNTFRRYLNEWTRELNALRPVGFPEVYARAPQRVFPPTLPRDYEGKILSRVTVENILKDPKFDHLWWAKLRRGERPEGVPVEAEGLFVGDRCRVSFKYPARQPLGVT